MATLLRLLIKATAILMLSAAASPAQTTDKPIDSDSTDIRVLEERVKQQEKNNETKLEAIRNEIEYRDNARKGEIDLRAKELEKRIEQYKWSAGIIITMVLAVLSFFGYKRIDSGIQNIIKKKTIEGLEVEWLKSYEIFSKERAIELEERYENRFKELEEKWTSYQQEMKKSLKKIEDQQTIPAEELEHTMKSLEEVKQEKEFSANDWFFKAYNEEQKGRYQKAIEYYSKAIDINPKAASAYNNRGFLYFNLNHFKKAVSDLDKAIELKPKFAIPFNNRGLCYHSLREYEKAIDDYNKAIEFDPSDFRPLSNLATTQIILGDYGDALKSVEKALTFESDDEALAILYYKKCIITKLLGFDTTEGEKAFTDLLEKEFTVETVSVDMIMDWISEADLPADTRKFIEEKTEMLKKKMK